MEGGVCRGAPKGRPGRQRAGEDRCSGVPGLRLSQEAGGRRSREEPGPLKVLGGKMGAESWT